MPPFKCHTGDKHVTVGESGVGSVSLLQNHYFIPHVMVYKVYPEVDPTRIPHHEALDC